jgi:hypothetical protein
MSILVRHDEASQLVVSQVRGVVAPKELLAMLDEVAAIVRANPIVGHLTDVSGSTPNLLRPMELSAVGERLRKLSLEPTFRALPVAVLIEHPLQYGLTRMVLGLAGGELPVRACRTIADCAEALKQPEALCRDALASLSELVSV